MNKKLIMKAKVAEFQRVMAEEQIKIDRHTPNPIDVSKDPDGRDSTKNTNKDERKIDITINKKPKK